MEASWEEEKDWHSYLQMLSFEPAQPFISGLAVPIRLDQFLAVTRFAARMSRGLPWLHLREHYATRLALRDFQSNPLGVEVRDGSFAFRAFDNRCLPY